MTRKRSEQREKTEPGVSRRKFVQAGALVGLPGALTASRESSRQPSIGEASLTAPANSEATLRNNIYTRLLGVRPHLGAHEHISRLGGGRMSPEVMQAMLDANDFFVDMHELAEAAGKHIAGAIGAEDAIVSCGGFSAMVLGAAACLTGSDQEKIAALPQVSWPKRECLIAPGHRFSYDRAYRTAGMEIVEANSKADFLSKLGEGTAMIAVLACAEKQRIFAPPFPVGQVPPAPDLLGPEELIEIGKKAGVPVLVDLASDIPPHSNPARFLQAGADLIVLSGGKGIGGPQATGFLAGRKDLIEAARLNNYPHDNIARGMKVGKEEVIGLIVALDNFLKLDYDAEINRWNAKAKWLAKQLQGIRGLKAEPTINTMGYTDVVLSWDRDIISLTTEQVKERLMQGEPRITWDITLRTRLLREGEEVLVAKRLRRFFEKEAS